MPAGLWRRVLAFALDYVLIAAYLVLLVGAGIVTRAVAPDVVVTLFGDPLTGEIVGFAVLTLPISLYFVLSEASASGATWGKRRMHLRVVSLGGDRLSLGQSALRTALKFVPWELTHALIWRFAFAGDHPPPYLDVGLLAVWLIVAGNVASVLVDRRDRSLYDRLSGTAVVRR